MVSYQTVKVSKKTEDSFTIRKSREFCLLENQLQRCGINTKTWSLVVVRLLISSVIEEYSNAGDIATQRHRVAQISNLQTSNTTSSKWLSTGRHGIPPIGIPNDQNPKMLLVMGTHEHRKFIFSTSQSRVSYKRMYSPNQRLSTICSKLH